MDNKPGMMAKELNENELNEIFGGAGSLTCECGNEVSTNDILAGAGMVARVGAAVNTSRVMCRSCVASAKDKGLDLSGFVKFF